MSDIFFKMLSLFIYSKIINIYLFFKDEKIKIYSIVLKHYILGNITFFTFFFIIKLKHLLLKLYIKFDINFFLIFYMLFFFY